MPGFAGSADAAAGFAEGGFCAVSTAEPEKLSGSQHNPARRRRAFI
jgi:hypothetical protein